MGRTPSAAPTQSAKQRYQPEVLLDQHNRPLIVFARGRTKYHAVEVRAESVALVALDTLRGLRPALHHGTPYSPRKAASFYLNHTWRPITSRAKAVLRGLVARRRGVV